MFSFYGLDVQPVCMGGGVYRQQRLTVKRRNLFSPVALRQILVNDLNLKSAYNERCRQDLFVGNFYYILFDMFAQVGSISVTMICDVVTPKKKKD